MEELNAMLSRNSHFYKGYSDVRPPMIKYPVIELPRSGKTSEFFVMTVPSTTVETEKMTAKMGGLLENDEILAEDGIYCYVICQLSDSEDNNTLDISKITLLAKKVQTIQEVHSAHGYIIRDFKKLYKSPVVVVLYAGELLVSTTPRKNKQVNYNFMSGTYMFSNSDRTDIFPEASRDAMIISSRTIQAKLGDVVVVYDNANETYLLPEEESIRMTKDKLITYFDIPGVVLRRFDTYDEAVAYYQSDWQTRLETANARFDAFKTQQERLRRFYKTQEEFDIDFEVRGRQYRRNIEETLVELNRHGTPINTARDIGFGIKKKSSKNKKKKSSKTKKKNHFKK